MREDDPDGRALAGVTAGLDRVVGDLVIVVGDLVIVVGDLAAWSEAA